MLAGRDQGSLWPVAARGAAHKAVESHKRFAEPSRLSLCWIAGKEIVTFRVQTGCLPLTSAQPADGNADSYVNDVPQGMLQRPALCGQTWRDAPHWEER
jgi:hypothetical protein